MAVNVVLNGVSYSIPEPGDTAWGQALTDYLVAQASGLLQKAGGSFSLTAEVDFGNTFGLKSLYFKSRTANPASAGQVRLANTDGIAWRNTAGDGDLRLEVNNLDELVYNNGVISQPVQGQITVTDTATIDLTLNSDDLSADIKAGSIDNSLIASAAAIALSKLATVTASRALVSDGSGFIAAATTTATEIGFVNGVTSAIQTQLNGKQASGNYITALIGEVTASGPGSASATLSTTAVTGKVLTGYTSGAGTVAATDSILQAIQKLNGNDGLKVDKSTFAAKGDLLTATASATPAALSIGSNGQVLTADSTQTTGMKWSNPGAATAPTIQKFLSTGTTTGYLFTVTSANATVGATYTNNGHTYTVLATIAGGTQLFTSQASAPTSSGTLTKASGTGDATITFSANIALATYTTPTSPAPLYIRVRAVGGGGGGGAGTGGSTATAGGNTNFGATIIAANGGGAATSGVVGNGGAGGTGGTASLGTGPIGTAVSGGKGGGGSYYPGANIIISGGSGAYTPFGGAGVGQEETAGSNAVANTGSGGGGGSTTNNLESGGGGGGGGFVDALITSLASTYAYVVGTAGSGAAAGSTGLAGGNGGSGYIEVTEYYQ